MPSHRQPIERATAPGARPSLGRPRGNALRRRAAWSTAALVFTGLVVGARPPADGRGASPPLAAFRTTQTGVVGRYVLRSVNGVSLPAPVAGEDPQHKVLVVDGVLEIKADGTYLCQTVSRTTYHGYAEQRADTINGGYDTIGGGSIIFGHRAVGAPPKTADTVVASGYQIIWTHGVRQGIGGAQFVYSK